MPEGTTRRKLKVALLGGEGMDTDDICALQGTVRSSERLQCDCKDAKK